MVPRSEERRLKKLTAPELPVLEQEIFLCSNKLVEAKSKLMFAEAKFVVLAEVIVERMWTHRAMFLVWALKKVHAEVVR
jgi:hypothetical protein